MAKRVVIRFSAEDIAVDGKRLDAIREQETDRLMANAAIAGTAPTREQVATRVKASIVSARECEKLLLDALIGGKLKEAKKVSEYNILADLAGRIENADGSIVLEKADIEKLRDGFEKVKDEDRQPFWVKCRSMFKQLENPEEVPDEPEPKAEAKPDPKPSPVKKEEPALAPA